MRDLEILGTQALVVERARQAAKDLRATRTAMVCENTHEGDDGFWAGVPCYRRVDDELIHTWCKTCQHRQVIHAAYTAAVNRQRVERMKLTRAAMRVFDGLPTEAEGDKT